MVSNEAFDGLNWLYNIVKKDSSLQRISILNVLTSVDSNVLTYLNFPSKPKISQVKDQLEMAKSLDDIFPYVFEPFYFDTKYNINSIAALKFRMANVSYIVKNKRSIVVNSYKFSFFALLIRFMILLKDSDKKNDDIVFHTYSELIFKCLKNLNELNFDFQQWSVNPSKAWFYEKVGKDYSYGQMVDLIDRQYDLYKQMSLSPQIFHFIFKCFGSYALQIADDAFNMYVESRNVDVSWNNAIQSFLKNYLKVSDSLSQQTAQNIINFA